MRRSFVVPQSRRCVADNTPRFDGLMKQRFRSRSIRKRGESERDVKKVPYLTFWIGVGVRA